MKSLLTKLVFMALALLVLPTVALAQTEEIVPELVVVTGIYELGADGKTAEVAGYVITTTATTVVDEGIEAGDAVVVTGYLLDDEVTIEAVSIELIADCDLDEEEFVDGGFVITTEDDDTETDPCVPPCDLTTTDDCDGDDSDDDDDTDNGPAACQRDDHPAGMRIAAEFEITYEEVMDLFCMGYGFGEITIMLSLADGDEDALAEILDLRSSGMGWGQIKKQYLADKDDDEDRSGTSRFADDKHTGKGKGGGKGNGNGNGNNGNNGNGNGNGNNGNNGNGNGNGNGKGNGKK